MNALENMKERIEDFVTDELIDYQKFAGIEDGQVDPVLSFELDKAVEELAKAIYKVEMWQYKNLYK